MVLTVNDIKQSREFYTNVLGFNIIKEFPEANRVIMTNGDVVIGIGLPPDLSQAPNFDSFSEHRVGLDHASFFVESHDALLEAIKIFDANNVPYGEIEDLSPNGFPIYVLAFRDPNNIQLELAAPAT
jgi:catechol 2,3-dioxygenase-like lactoylglutathione lyase family enzyme